VITKVICFLNYLNISKLEKSNDLRKKENICMSKQCIETGISTSNINFHLPINYYTSYLAALIMEKMNEEANPCN
jgi:hypothetical protein